MPELFIGIANLGIRSRTVLVPCLSDLGSLIESPVPIGNLSSLTEVFSQVVATFLLHRVHPSSVLVLSFQKCIVIRNYSQQFLYYKCSLSDTLIFFGRLMKLLRS